MLMSRGGNAALQLMPQAGQTPVAGAALAGNGALVLVGGRGVRTLSVE
jgi:hypothetical protein